MKIKKVKNVIFSCVMPMMLISCADTQFGTFGVGNPVALSPDQSMESLKNYATYLQNRVTKPTSKDSAIEDLDPLGVNRSSSIEYINVQKNNLLLIPGSGTSGQAAGQSGSPQGANGATAIIPQDSSVKITNTDPPKRGGLMMDKISTLEAYAAHKQRLFDLPCLYSDSKYNLYKVSFTLWVEPERQYLWTYLWRWLDLKDGFRNYTKDYHVDVLFTIVPPTPTPENKTPNPTSEKKTPVTTYKTTDVTPKPAKVVRLEPEHEGSISDEYFGMMSQSELGISAAWQEIAAKSELAERLRQAEVEQRKYPILRSYIDSFNKNKEADFHFIISPRQHVEERTFRIPYFMSPYTINRRLESVPYNVSAYFLVPKGQEDNGLSINVKACYKEFGKPEKDSCDFNKIGKDQLLTIDLPKSPDDSKETTKHSCSVSDITNQGGNMNQVSDAEQNMPKQESEKKTKAIKKVLKKDKKLKKINQHA
jgi:hypothetical protein